MTMTPADSSYAAVRAARPGLTKEEVGRLFYSGRKTEMALQVSKLTHALDVSVKQVENREEIRDWLRDLGTRHVDNGVKPEHYVRGRHSLLWAVAQTPGPERWSREVEQPIGWVLDEVSAAMLGVEVGSASVRSEAIRQLSSGRG